MTAPTIQMIANSLRSCSLGRRPTRTPSPPPGPARRFSDDSGGVQLELKSDVALPYHWEQCLDIRTGKIYYINWEDGSSTTTDPRISTSTTTTTISSSSSDEDSTSGHVGKAVNRSGTTTGYSSNISALSSDESSTAESVVVGGDITAHVLVAAGCKACFMYFMVPKRVESCSRCGGELLLLGRDGCV